MIVSLSFVLRIATPGQVSETVFGNYFLINRDEILEKNELYFMERERSLASRWGDARVHTAPA
jgi:hypothetical protein